MVENYDPELHVLVPAVRSFSAKKKQKGIVVYIDDSGKPVVRPKTITLDRNDVVTWFFVDARGNPDPDDELEFEVVFDQDTPVNWKKADGHSSITGQLKGKDGAYDYTVNVLINGQWVEADPRIVVGGR